MAGAKAAGTTPLVTFDRSRKRTSHNPSAAQMAKLAEGVRKRYPFVKEFATWNEANINKRPETVAQLVAGDAQGVPDVHGPRRRPARPPQRRHVGQALRQGGQADAEGLGPAQLQRRQHAEDDRHAHAAQGRQGRGLVHRDRRRRLAQQRLDGEVPDRRRTRRKATKFVFTKLVKLSPRVQRAYIYHWNTGVGDGRTWDSGLIGPDDKGRPASIVAGAIGVRPARCRSCRSGAVGAGRGPSTSGAVDRVADNRT